MKKRMVDSLVLVAVLLAALIAGWVLIEGSVGRAGTQPTKLPSPVFPTLPPSPKPTPIPTPPPAPTPSPSPSLYDEPVVPWERTQSPSPSPSEEPTQSPSPYPWEGPSWYASPSPSETPTPTPTPYYEPTPPPFDYTLLTNKFCDRAKRILDGFFQPRRRPPISPRCTGSYDTETGDYSFTLEFTFTPPN